jgi:hypothetical protein
MRRLAGLIALGLGFLSSCSTYEIPEQETARINEEVKKGRLEQINLEQLFPEDQKFPKLKDYFFYIIYHLERSGKEYVLDRQQLEEYFKKHNLTSFIPFGELEKIVKEDGVLKLYNDDFSESIPGASMIYLDASENIHFQTSRLSHRVELEPLYGSLELKPSFFIALLGYNFESKIQEIHIYDKGKNIMFKCQVLIRGKSSYWDVVYHSEDGSSSTREGIPSIKEVGKRR